MRQVAHVAKHETKRKSCSRRVHDGRGQIGSVSSPRFLRLSAIFALILYCLGFCGWLFLLVSVLQLISYPCLWQVLESRTIGKRRIQRILARLRFFRHLKTKERLILVYFWSYLDWPRDCQWWPSWISRAFHVLFCKFKRKRAYIFSSSFIHF